MSASDSIRKDSQSAANIEDMDYVNLTSKSISSITSQNILLKKKYNELNSKYSNLQKRHDSEIHRLENSMKGIVRQHNDQLSVLNSTITSLQESLDKLRTENTELKNSYIQSQSNCSPINFPKISISDEYNYKMQTIEYENKKLTRDLESQIEINNILQDKVNTIPEYEHLLKQSQDEIKKLKKQCTFIEQSDESAKTIKFYKNQLSSLQTKCADQEATISELKTTVSELKFELSSAKSELSQKESEISQILCDLPQNKDNEDNEEIFNQTLEIFDNLSKEQTNQIVELTKQRNEILTILHKYEKIESLNNDYLSHSNEENQQLKDQIEDLQQKLEQAIEESDNKVNELVESIGKIYEYEIDQDKSPIDNIVELIENRIVAPDSPSVKSNRERELKVLGQLENALKFFKTLAGSSSDDDTPIFNFQDRTFILTQCARIGQFIEEEAGDVKIPSVPNLFDPLEIESCSKVFFDFLENEEDINESPIRELYLMFLSCISVNFLLFNRVKELLSRKPTPTVRIDDSFRELYEEILNEIKDSEKVLGLYVDNPDNNFFSMLQIFVGEYEELRRENDDNIAAIEQLQAELIEVSQLTQNSSMMPEGEFKTIKSKIRKLKDDKRKLQECLNKEIKYRKSSNEKSRKQLEEAVQCLNIAKNEQEEFEKLKNKYQNLKQLSKDQENELNQYKEKLTELNDENEMLLKEKEELEASSESRIEELQENERKVREKNSSLAKRVTDLEKTNNEMLVDIKKRTEIIQEKLHERIQNLDNELKETREKLIKNLTEIKELRSIKHSNQVEITKLKFEVKNRSYMINQLTSQMKLKEEQFSAKSKAEVFQQQVKCDKLMNELSSNYDTARMKLVGLLKKKFNVTISETDSFNVIINALNRLIDEKMIAEMTTLNIDARSLINEIKKMENRINSNETTIEDLEMKNAIISKQNEALTKKNSQLENAQDELNKWISWARSIHRHITDGQVGPHSVDDLKYVLEESLMAAIGHRNVLRKLDIIRREKKILNSPMARKCIEKVPTQNRPSIRPVILALMWTRRLQIFGSYLTSAYKCGPNESNTFDEEI
ncbi:hypothetical protein TRFO_05040 [Tritrichomonas foetus]|uniref:Uncharacterized protein n=1 Tax=Tritrichomonas foetus TaxID=1144522 RepID=A0A1J4KEW5_9EUKA|nr:hypothetical protein TRFO_05040 [Tritrichomonas foetus]|eukprot:OHT07925.1 hypothetical protein TRFO_05040 [Tritrichomonas foetus]